ncbi:hypothetical protein SAMN06295973_1260 [Plantibacter cousiniae]|uniref:Uncharacterized protein n=1 Tax=Plantibacter cousiniae (nom. nud.) TaxID=199709 RepID=A0ABY1LL06_9MICO|nr:hypothetical protein SAMN06295973_1260 [Plantibacter cousiniae]
MGLIQDVGGGLLLALGLLLAGLVLFLVLALGTQYVRMRRRRPQGKLARAEAELRRSYSKTVSPRTRSQTRSKRPGPAMIPDRFDERLPAC